MRPVRLAALIALTLGLALPAQAETGSNPAANPVPFTPTASRWRESVEYETLATVPQDARGIVSYPFTHPKAFGKSVLLIGALVVFDKPLTNYYQNHIEPLFRNFHLPAAPVSFPQVGIMSEDVWMLTGMAGSYIYGSLVQDDRAKRAALLSSKALAYSYLTSELVLKTVFSRKRPYEDLNNPSGDPNLYTENPWDFFDFSGGFLSPFRSGRSMPSYHFTEYFAVARIYSGIYNDSAWPYGVAALLAVSNIDGHHHWVSDMVAGSMIGYGIGSLVLKNDRNWQAGHFQAMPVVGPDAAGVTLTMQF